MSREAGVPVSSPGVRSVTDVLWHGQRQSRLALLIVGHASWFMLGLIVLALVLPDTWQGTPIHRAGLWWIAAVYALYTIFLEYASRVWPARYRSQRFRVWRIVFTLIIVSLLVLFSGGESSFLWILYLLPILQTTLYFRRSAIVLVTGTVALSFVLCAYSSSRLLGRQVDFIRVGALLSYIGLFAFLSDYCYRLVNGNAESLKREVARRQNELDLLELLSSRILAAPSLRAALQCTLEDGMRAIGASFASIMLVDAASQNVEIQAWLVDGRFEPDKTHNQPTADRTIAKHVIASGRSYLYSYDPERIDPYFAPSASGRTVGSLLSVPILANESVIGVINADDERADHFTQRDLDFVEVLAGLVAIAVETHGLRALGIELATLDHASLSERLVASAATLTGAEHSTLFLINEASNRFERVCNYPPSRQKSEGPRPDGLTQQIVESGEPLVISDIDKVPRVKKSTRDEKIKSILGVPLFDLSGSAEPSQRACIGVLWVNSKRQRHWSEHQLKLLESVAGHASAALANVRLFSETQRHLQQMTKLNKVALELTGYQPRSELFDSILSSAVSLLEAQGAALYLLKPGELVLKLVALSGLPEHLINTSVAVNAKSVTGRVVLEREAFTVSNYREWDYRLPVFDNQRFTAVAGAPLISCESGRDEVLGVIVAQDVEPGRTFSPADLALLKQLANLAAIGLETNQQRDDLVQLFDDAAYAITEVDVKGRIVRYNKMAADLYGYPVDQLIGSSVTMLYDPPTEAIVVQRRLSRSENNRVLDIDTQIRNKRGETIPIKLSAFNLVDAEGNHRGSVGFFRDRRQSTQLQSLLDASERIAGRNLNGLGKSLTLADIVLDTAIKISSASGGALFRLEREDGVAQAWSRRGSAPRHVPVDENLVGRVCRNRETELLSNYYQHPDRLKHLDQYGFDDVLALPICYGRRTWGALVVHTRMGEPNIRPEDIDYLEVLCRLAAVAMENNRLQPLRRINVALTLLSRWGHRAQNTITKLRLNFQSLKYELPDGVPVYDTLLTDMSDQLSELAYPADTLRRESDQVLMEERREINLAHLLSSISEGMRQQYDSVEIDSTQLEGRDLPFAGSQLLLETAFQVLIENACTAGAKLNRPLRVELTATAKEYLYLVTIQDDGPGIPADIRDRIFEQPVRSDTGFGYGSYVAANIIRAEEGDIMLDDSTTVGTLIIVRLPRKRREQEGVGHDG